MVWDLANCSFESGDVGAAVRCSVNGTILTYATERLEKEEEECEEVVPPGSADFWGFFFASLICICFAGAMSGLTVGLMSFDEKGLSVLMAQSKDERERYHAARVLSLIKNHHMLLVTLLFWNAAAFESLPIFLDKLVPSWAAILISVTLILIFGEIVPQAVCTGPRKLVVGSNSYWLVWSLIIITYPIAWVFAKALDAAVGHGGLGGGSKFMYLPRSTLGLEQDPNAMALVELHGIEEEIAPKSPVVASSRRTSTLSLGDTKDELPPVVVKDPVLDSSEADTTKLVISEEGEIDDNEDNTSA